MKVNKQLFEDVLSGKLKGTFVTRNGWKIDSDMICRNTDDYYSSEHEKDCYPYMQVNNHAKTYTISGRINEFYAYHFDIVDFIPDTDMKENESTIEIPDGKTYKRMPFDIELAKDIQSGKVEGRIVTEEGELVRILCFNREHYCNILALCKVPNEYGESLLCAEFNTGRYHQRIEEEPKDKDKFLFIELPEEAPKQDSFTKKLHDTAEVLATPRPQFKPFDKVLVRSSENACWCTAIYSHYDIKDLLQHVACGIHWKYCIPYEGNEQLVGTTDNC